MIPARNGDWNRFGSVAVTEFHRSVLQERRELPRIVEPARGEIRPALLLEDPAVELVVPEDLELLALRVVVGARQRTIGEPPRL